MTTVEPKAKFKGEASFEDAFSTFWTDEEFHDATLEATDGLRVTANRYALAGRNVYFRKLFMGKWKEKKSPVVTIGYSGSVLKAVVEYIHTSKAALLLEHTEDETNKAKKAKTDVSDAICLTFQSVLELREAAGYFDLPGLSYQAHKCISSFLKEHPSLAFAILGSSSVAEDIRELAFTKIQRDPEGCSKGAAVKLLSPVALQNLLTHDKEKLRMSPFQLFDFLETWARNEPVKGTKPASAATNVADRPALATKLVADHIDLSQISPTNLSSSVASSGLVSNEQLLEAYKLQALKAEKDHGVKFGVMPPVVWKASQSTELKKTDERRPGMGCSVNDIFDCEPITTGKHQWSILVKTATNDDCLGVGVVTSKASNDPMPYLGDIDGSWGYFGDGTVESSGRRADAVEEDQTFTSGSTVTLTLDLCPGNEQNGSLSISVDNGPTITSVFDLLNYIDDGGFYPAASLGYRGNCVEIMDFQAL